MGKNQPIIIATGGSGGHVIPAEVLGNKLLNAGMEILFLGHGVSQNSFFKKTPKNLRVDVISAPFSLKKFPLFFSKVLVGFFQAFIKLIVLKPSCVIGFGSYHSFPVMLAAKVLHIPMIVYESNIKMGKVIKLFAPSCKVLASPFNHFSSYSNFEYVKPLIPDLELDLEIKKTDLYLQYGLDPSKKTLLIFGGSQGAEFFNQTIRKDLVELLEKDLWQLLHIVGPKADHKNIQTFYTQHGFNAVCIGYEPCMQKAYSIADQVIARCGSTTLFELKKMHIPAILIPFAHSMDNHQLLNAKIFSKNYPSVLIEEQDYSRATLKKGFDLLKQIQTEVILSEDAAQDIMVKVKQVCRMQ